MYAIEEESARAQSVTLYVTDPARSQDFYQDLFGLVVREHAGTLRSRVLQPVGAQGGVAIVLRSRRDGSEGPVWLSVEVGSVSEVLDLYLLAIMMGAPAMLPRKRGERWNTVVTDPDQNRVSIWTRVDDENEETERAVMALRPQRWDWQMSPHGAEMMDEELDQRLRQALFDTDNAAASVPGRSASGVSRERGAVGGGGGTGCKGGTPYPARSCERKLEGKE